MIFYGVLCMSILGHGQEVYHRSFTKMGSSFSISVVSSSTSEANRLIDMGVEEIDRIEQLISSWNPSSSTAAINRNAGKKAVEVPRELYDLIKRSKTISRLCDGAFDISYASMDALWSFAGEAIKRPPADQIAASVAKIGYDKITLSPETNSVLLPIEGMKIGFGAIGKGYAADRVKALLIKEGSKAGIVNASGDMVVWGKQPNGQPWQVGIVNPMNNQKVFAHFSLDNNAVVTSGDYERFLYLEGERYGHIIDPRTGYPVKGVISCTVFAPKAELADALATALYVMGIESGIALVDQIPNVSAIMIDQEGKIHNSKKIEIDEES